MKLKKIVKYINEKIDDQFYLKITKKGNIKVYSNKVAAMKIKPTSKNNSYDSFDMMTLMFMIESKLTQNK